MAVRKIDVENIINQMENVDPDTKPSREEIPIAAITGNISENLPTPFLPINESWQREMCNVF